MLLVAQEMKPADRRNYEQALDQYANRHYSEAAKQMRRVAARYPKEPDPQFWLGMMAVKDGFNITAIRRYFSKCIELDPNYPNPLSHYYMALIHYTDERYGEAEKELNAYFLMSRGMDDKEVNKVYDEASNYLYWAKFLSDAEVNKAPFNPVKLQGVSSVHNEIFPFISADGLTVYYLRQVPVKRPQTFYVPAEVDKEWKLYSSQWQDTAFSKGTPLPAPFNSGLAEGSVSLTADGEELYYSIIQKKDGYANSDIYRVKRKNGVWQKPENCGRQVNGELSWESQPTISADGKTLIFASNRKGGMGGIDLWRCHRLSNGDWSRAENLGSAVNTAGNEKAPFLAADGRTLYFLSDGWQGFGGYDIYFTNIQDNHRNCPTNLGLPINTENDEMSFGVTVDGRRAYLGCRTEGSQSSDVLVFDLYENARPEPMRIVHLNVQDTVGKPVEGWCTLVVSEGRSSTLCIEEEGMFPELLTIGACDKQRKVILKTISPGSVHQLQLGSGLEERMQALAQWLTGHPRVHLSVECPHKADAQKVLDLLKSHGLRAERFEMRYGSEIKQPQLRVL